MAAAPGEPEVDAPAPAPRAGAAAAFLIGLGIFSSRVVGLVRERVLATYFGTGLHADVFSAGLRLPNVLQNLLGEGTLSASFIPASREELATLLDVYILEKAVYELQYELNNRPAWVGIPLQGIQQILGASEGAR